MPKQKEISKEASEFEKLWSEYELLKMDVVPNSKWYILSCNWLQKWRDYVAFKTNKSTKDVQMEVEFPGMILNDDIIDKAKDLLEDYANPHLNVGLMENLREGDHYYVVNDKVWEFLYTRYGGIEILRIGTERKGEDPFIEVNLLKLNIHYFPGQQDSDTHVHTIYESRFTTVKSLREKLAGFKDRQADTVKLWKAPMPSDFEAFYRNNLCEFRKHREIRLDALLLKDYKKVLDEIEFSLDDFLIVECRVQGGFIFEEIEKVESDDHLTSHVDFEEIKDQLSDASSLSFLQLDIRKLLKNNSNAGLSGLSNLGNT